ncbi:MAG TPA: iron ABC transporter permease [Acidimicrobiaceae bacterium]|nr:iron ABC transporter permease [Acidimicrobiaceae bacterium]
MNLLTLTSPSLQTLSYMVIAIVSVGITISFSRRISISQRSLRRGSFSSLTDLRVLRLCIGTVALTVLLALIGLEVGEYPIPGFEAIKTAFWNRGGEFDFIVNSLRFPRVVAALLAGFCLATSGALFQSLLGNPLVSPDVIGINSGAALCAVFVLTAGADLSVLPWAAFLGAVLTAVVIYLLAWKQGISGSRLVLVGIGINALLASGITYLMVKYPIERVVAAARWQIGSLFGSSWADVRILALGVVVLTPLALFLVPKLRLLQLGDELATGLGSRVEMQRMAIIVVASAYAALAVAVIGPLGFVALLVPHMVRLIVGSLTGGVLLLTGFVGALFLLGCDLIAQQLFAPTTLPVGVVTAALGGPYFLFILVRYNRAL